MSAPMVRRWEHVTNVTVAELVAWCETNGLDPAAVDVTGTHLKWQTAETDEERVTREDHARRAAERTETWERAALLRFIDKYGVPE